MCIFYTSAILKKEGKMERIKDISVRALKTFIQGFLGALTITLPSSDLSNQAVVK